MDVSENTTALPSTQHSPSVGASRFAQDFPTAPGQPAVFADAVTSMGGPLAQAEAAVACLMKIAGAVPDGRLPLLHLAADALQKRVAEVRACLEELSADLPNGGRNG